MQEYIDKKIWVLVEISLVKNPVILQNQIWVISIILC